MKKPNNEICAQQPAERIGRIRRIGRFIKGFALTIYKVVRGIVLGIRGTIRAIRSMIRIGRKTSDTTKKVTDITMKAVGVIPQLPQLKTALTAKKPAKEKLPPIIKVARGILAAIR